MKVLACATEHRRGVERLIGSGARHGLDIELVAQGQTWAHNAAKLEALLPSVSMLPGSELVLILDAYDVLLFAAAEELARRFAQTDGRPIFNGELGFYCPAPWEDAARRAFDRDVPYPFLNSGVLLGRAADLTALLTDAAAVVQEYDLISDQAAFYRLALDAPDRIAVDHAGALFCCTGAMDFHGLWNRSPRRVEIRDGTVVDLATGGRPCILHSPGRKDRYQERVYRASAPHG